MTLTNSEISLYVDTMIVETLLGDGSLSKTAQASGFISQLIDKVKSYVGNNINQSDKVGSALNILAPGALSIAFRAMGLGWLGLLLGLAMRIFHIDVAGMLRNIWEKVKSALGDGKQMSSAEVDSIVSGVAADHNTPATEQEANQAERLLQTQSVTLRDAQMLRFAMVQYDKLNSGLIKEAGFFDLFSSHKSKTTSLLGVVFGWVFKIVLASAGLMVAGDVVNKFIGMPSALDGTVRDGKPVANAPAPVAAGPIHVATQTKFKIQPGYHDEHKNIGDSWVESISNDVPSIENMLITFAKQVYQGLDQMDSVIRATPGFQVLRDRIAFYNRASSGGPMVFLPKYLTSKKQIVDAFIDDVAEKAP
jgi:hypothetical protein